MAKTQKSAIVEGIIHYAKLETADTDQYGNTNYQVDLVLTKQIEKQLSDFKIGSKSIKKMDSEEYKEKYHVDPPEDVGPLIKVIKVKQPAKVKDMEFPPRKVAVLESDGVARPLNGRLVANGSKAKLKIIAVGTNSNDGSDILRLGDKLLITEFIEYESNGGSDDFSEFGVDVEGEFETPKQTVQTDADEFSEASDEQPDMSDDDESDFGFE